MKKLIQFILLLLGWICVDISLILIAIYLGKLNVICFFAVLALILFLNTTLVEEFDFNKIEKLKYWKNK